MARMFKIGDIVTPKPDKSGRFAARVGAKAVVKSYTRMHEYLGPNRHDEWMVIEWLDATTQNGQAHGSYFQEDFQLVTAYKQKFIVSLLTRYGSLRPSPSPVIHNTKEEAEAEAMRLAAHPSADGDFAVLTIVSVAKRPERPEPTLIQY